jgi:hypothetical protein
MDEPEAKESCRKFNAPMRPLTDGMLLHMFEKVARNQLCFILLKRFKNCSFAAGF